MVGILLQSSVTQLHKSELQLHHRKHVLHFRAHRRSGAGEEPDQVDGALESGARVCGDEAEVRICEAALPRTEEECQPSVRGVRSGEPVSAAEEAAASGTSIAPLRRLLITSEPPKRAATGKKKNPSAPTGMLNTQRLKDTGLFRVSLGRNRRQPLTHHYY